MADQITLVELTHLCLASYVTSAFQEAFYARVQSLNDVFEDNHINLSNVASITEHIF